MRVFELGVVVVALIVLTILIVCFFSAWMAFEKSLDPALRDINSCPIAERNVILASLNASSNGHSSRRNIMG
jgi:hypothetical protein